MFAYIWCYTVGQPIFTFNSNFALLSTFRTYIVPAVPDLYEKLARNPSIVLSNLAGDFFRLVVSKMCVLVAWH